ncbi:MAG: hypothetical protein LBM20_00005, partial [Rikenellaceae bacterium]|nr:hypothetical protein [Rikenellaceae bacterium]
MLLFYVFFKKKKKKKKKRNERKKVPSFPEGGVPCKGGVVGFFSLVSYLSSFLPTTSPSPRGSGTPPSRKEETFCVSFVSKKVRLRAADTDFERVGDLVVG